MLTHSEKSGHNAQYTDGARQCTSAASTHYNYQLTSDRADQVNTDCVVVTIGSDGALSPAGAAVDRAAAGLISDLLGRGTFSGIKGSTLFVPLPKQLPAKAVLLAGVGTDAGICDRDFRALVQAVYAALTTVRVHDAVLFLADVNVDKRDNYWKIRQQLVSLEEAAYRFRPDAAAKAPRTLEDVFIASQDHGLAPLVDGHALAAAVRTARTLGDMPANVCTPEFLAEFARSIASRFSSVSAEVLDTNAMSDLGMGAMLSVGAASAQDSRLILLNYQGSDVSQSPIVLIGKGVTFDTGGTTLKTRQGMRMMKYDMCGAAVVMSVLQAVATLRLPINVVAVAACAENMLSGNATRPSDVVTSMSGKTVEILNPDAEGRLLLCDTLTYVEQLAPELVIDVATLTGASLAALGRHYSAMFTDDEALSAELLDAGETAMDNVWRLPLSVEDLDQLDSRFADVANMGDGTAGCVVAALFLSKFVRSYRWAHLDVSGTAKIHGEIMGATGRPVALLLQYLLNRTRSTSKDSL